MPFRNEDWLPSYEELEVDEINMTAAPLRASAVYFGKYCDQQCKEFMLCDVEEKDPRKCVSEGKEVTRCGLEFFQKLKKNCAAEFTAHWKCVDHAGYEMFLPSCRKTQAAFDKCMLDQLGMERPEPGYFSRVRVHHTNRPKPEKILPLPEPTPDPIDPKTAPIPESAKYGSRNYFFS